MAEAEDVITAAALRTTTFVQGLWRRHRAHAPPPATLELADVAQRLDLLITAVFGVSYRLRTAPLPARPTFLARALQRRTGPRVQGALPATDGRSIWLPAQTGLADAQQALERFRIVALQQAMRASRGSAAGAGDAATPLVRELYLLVEAHAADAALARLLPGMLAPLNAWRAAALRARPPVPHWPTQQRALEAWLRQGLASPVALWGAGADNVVDNVSDHFSDTCASVSPLASRRIARQLASEFMRGMPADSAQALLKDWWTGDLIPPPTVPSPGLAPHVPPDLEPDRATRSARLARRPEVRQGTDDEDDKQPGAWMIQAAAPHEVAEDPFGLQRPTDRDDQMPAEEFAESLAELAQARLVTNPGRPQEVLLSDDPPDAQARRATAVARDESAAINYPEWDHRIQAYRSPGASVHELNAPAGAQQWVDDTLAEHRTMLDSIRRRFELLRAQRSTLRRQLDGDELDLEACIDAQADLRAGLAMPQALYRAQRRTRRDLAVLLLIDTSGSTDSWVSGGRRVIDVEREALLLVCIALAALGEPYAVQAFSGHGPQRVTVRTLKGFDEPYSHSVATRIAALEPEQYTRAGAAIRHASATLARQNATHRLLLLLSDGKPNDVDVYAGRYGVEDMRRAVVEARMQGIAPFCLTVDRQAAAYLPGVFGAHHYAMLMQPALLPSVLLDWMRRLLLA